MQPVETNPGNDQLIEKIRARIRKERRITFAEFMDMALYDPEYGYYISGKETAGTEGDFLTSVSMSPAFGAVVANWIASVRLTMCAPDPFEIVEIGAGKGLLCAGILTHLRESYPEIYSAVKYRIIEAPGTRNNLSPFGHPLMEDFPGKIQIDDSMDDLGNSSITGCFVSNELMDALPVHMVTELNGRLAEIYVTLDGDRFVEVVGPLSDNDIGDYFDRINVSLPEGYRTEVNINAVNLIQQISMKLAVGYVLTIDYGHQADDYYSPEHSRGTMMCYYRHTYCEDPFARIGEQDITAHVDFTSLMRAGDYAGLETDDLVLQKSFLTAHGIRAWLESRQRNQADTRAVNALLDPNGLGGFKVLIQKKSVLGCEVQGG
ncbi:MAG: class I SAM-dependent methyltransferase [Armatimonadota bacterium]